MEFHILSEASNQSEDLRVVREQDVPPFSSAQHGVNHLQRDAEVRASAAPVRRRAHHLRRDIPRATLLLLVLPLALSLRTDVISRGGVLREVLGGGALGASLWLGTSRVAKAEPKTAYDTFARDYDGLDGGSAASLLGIDELRRKLAGLASGKVLEVACGTGLQFALYASNPSISSVNAVDLSRGMLQEARVKAKALDGVVPFSLGVMDAEALEFGDNTFDTVVDTFSLCVFERPARALAEMRRVCRPGGKVLLLENNRSSFGPLAAYQDATADIIAQNGGKGCKWNQNVRDLAVDSGLTVNSVSSCASGLFALLECHKADS